LRRRKPPWEKSAASSTPCRSKEKSRRRQDLEGDSEREGACPPANARGEGGSRLEEKKKYLILLKMFRGKRRDVCLRRRR